MSAPKELRSAECGEGVPISCDRISVAGHVRLGDNISIDCEELILGDGAVIEDNVAIHGIGKRCKRVVIGDETLLGFNGQFLVPEFSLGDYSAIHNTCLANGHKALTLGHNCWVGQRTILNSTERLSIGNNVRIGTQSQIWTHVASGELLEGSTLYGSQPVDTRDNVWLVGGVVVSPGLELMENTVVMTGSVMTKSTQAFHTYSGVPAVDVSDKIQAWREVKADEKWRMLAGFVREFSALQPGCGAQIQLLDGPEALDAPALDEEGVVVLREAGNLAAYTSAKATVMDLATKRYLKRRSPIEKAWLRFGVGHRFRFLPL